MDANCLFQEELEALQAIYMDDLIVNMSYQSQVQLEITLHPSTADQDDLKNVCLTLICSIDSVYPDNVAKVLLKNPRGLSDAHFASIEENLRSLAQSKIGEVMLFDLLEYAKESLTDNNHPSCVCPICFEHFQDSEQFFRTECYHYFHLPCMKGYIDNYTDEKYVCPVCRFPISVSNALLMASQVDVTENPKEDYKFVPDENYLKWRRECDVLFKKQQRNGGIIDLEYEKNKYLIKSENRGVATRVISTVSDPPEKEFTTTEKTSEYTGFPKKDVDSVTKGKSERHITTTSSKPYRKKNLQYNRKTDKMECSCSDKQKTEASNDDSRMMASQATTCKCSSNKNEYGTKLRKKKTTNRNHERICYKENSTQRRHGSSETKLVKQSYHSKNKPNNRRKITEVRDSEFEKEIKEIPDKEEKSASFTGSQNDTISPPLDKSNGGTAATKVLRPPPGFEKHPLNNSNAKLVQDTGKVKPPPPGF